MRPSRLLLCFATTGCIASNSLSLSTQNTARPRVRETSSLGVYNVDAANGFGASMFLADSVLRELGWSMASVNRDRNEMATQWLFVDGPIFDPANVHRCGSGSDVGIRVIVSPRKQGDSSRYSIRGEMQLAETAPIENERVAHDGYEVAVARLRTALARPASAADTLVTRVRAISGEGRVSTSREYSACSSVQVQRASP